MGADKDATARARVARLVSFAVGGVAVPTLASMMQSAAELWVALGGAILLGGVAYLTMRGGPLQRRTEGVSPAQQFAAMAMLLFYIAGSVYAAQNWSVVVATAVTGILTAAAVTLAWPALRPTVDFSDLLVGLALLLGGVAGMLGGVAYLVSGTTLVGAAFLLIGVAFLLYGVALLLGGTTVVGAALLLGGVAFLLVGVAAMLGGTTLGLAPLLGGVAALLLGVALVLLGLAFLLGRAVAVLLGVTILLGAVAAMLGGVATVLVGMTLVGVATVLGGVAFLAFGGALLLDWGSARSKLSELSHWLLRPQAHTPPLASTTEDPPGDHEDQ